MDYEDYRGKVLEIISNNRRFCKIKDVYESGNNIIVKTIDDLEYTLSPDEFRILRVNKYVATESHILYYLHDEIPEGYFNKEMSEQEKLWRTFNRMRDCVEDLNGCILHYFTKVKYWINDSKREDNARKITQVLSNFEIEMKLRNILLKLQAMSDDINYPDFKWNEN